MVVSKPMSGAVAAVLLGGVLWAATPGGPGQAGPQVSSRTLDPVHDCSNPTGLFIGDVISCVVGQG
jgi:hypothetical protein